MNKFEKPLNGNNEKINISAEQLMAQNKDLQVEILALKAMKYFITIDEVKISALRKKFGFNFPKVASVIDQLEDWGYIIDHKVDKYKKQISIDMPTFVAKFGEIELD